MGAPRITPTSRPINLKASCDMQLQAAFHEERWSDAANLAQKRFKSTKDKYYHAIEIAAKCQSDSAADRSVGLVEIERLLKNPKAIEDADTLDLYEYACAETRTDYLDQFGAVRAQIVRAAPKDYVLSLRCFEACLWNRDWKNAQMVAASMDKNFVKERKFLFRNILTTFLVAMSKSADQNAKKLFSNLAKAHIDKALKLRVPAESGQAQPLRAIATEEEFLLWLDIRFNLSTPEDNMECFKQSQTSPLAFIELGFTRCYCSMMLSLEKYGAWDRLLQIGKQILDTSIEICRKEASAVEDSLKETEGVPSQTETQAKARRSQAIQRVKGERSSKDQRYLAECSDWNLWFQMVSAAQNLPDSKAELKKVGKLVDKMVRAMEPLEAVRPVFRKNLGILELKILFARDSRPETQILRLAKYVEGNCTDPACFRMLKPRIAQLSQHDRAGFLQLLENSSANETNKLRDLMLTSLILRVRYLQATSAARDKSCEACQSPVRGTDCMACIRLIALQALESFSSAIQDESLEGKESGEDDPLAVLTTIGSECLLKFAGLGQSLGWNRTNSPLFYVDLQIFLQAVLWTEYYVASKPTNDALRLLLVKLYLLLGCVSRAYHLWDSFDVKNAILNSLTSLYFDRLSTISPGDFTPGSSRSPVGPIKTYYNDAMRRHLPSLLRTSIEHENYGSFIDAISFADELSRSCTVVMAIVEERRGVRMRCGRCDGTIEGDHLINYHTIEDELKDFTDYNYLPKFAAAESQPLERMINYGPLPTNDRSQLSLLAERFFDIVSPVQTKDYKPTKTRQAIQSDWQNAVSACNKIRKEMGLFYTKDGIEDVLTKPEYWYYRIVWELVDIVKIVLEHGIMAPATNEFRDEARSRIKHVLGDLAGQSKEFLVLPRQIAVKIDTIHGATALHAMGMLRESGLVVKQTAAYLTAAFDRIKVVNKSRGSNEGAWLAADLKEMAAAAAESDGAIKSRIKLLNERLNTSGWMDLLEDWTLGEYGATYLDPRKETKKQISEGLRKFVPQCCIEDWTVNITDSWRDNLRGWSSVKFD